jgi:curli biogenesis system outer membrane secretion channel CsgG
MKRFSSTLIVATLLATACERNAPAGLETQNRQGSPTPPSSPQVHRQDIETGASDGRTTRAGLPSRSAHVKNEEGALTPTESSLIRGGGISTDGVANLLSAQRFDVAVRKFERESSGDADAADLTQAYRAAILRQLAGSARLTQFACTTNMCIGSITAQPNNDAYVRWADMFFASKETPHHVFNDMTHSLGANTFENRFVFSTDPSLASAVTRP